MKGQETPDNKARKVKQQDEEIVSVAKMSERERANNKETETAAAQEKSVARKHLESQTTSEAGRNGYMFENNSSTIEDDEESALHSILPPVIQESVTDNDGIEQTFVIENDVRSIDIEQDAIGNEREGAETAQENIAGDADEATAVFSAYLAPTPEETHQRRLDNAVDAINVRIHPSEQRTSQNQNKWKIPLIGLGVVVAIAIAVSLGVILSGRTNKETTSSVSPTPAPTSARFGQAASLVETLFNTTFEDPSAPQYQAIQWIANEDAWFDDLASIDPERFGQRYALALLYFATGGTTSWIDTSFFLKPDVHECEWRDTAIPKTQSWSGNVGIYNCSSDDWAERIEINQNNLTGTLPSELGSLSSLVELTVFQNKLSGTLPTSIFNLVNLQYLVLTSNEFSGTIPTEIGRLTSLLNLYLQANSFAGSIPSEIGNLSSLDQLGLGINFLTGSIPTTLLQLSNITWLEFGLNLLTGTLPASLWSSWPSLRVFGVLDNQMSGTIPTNLDSVSLLEQLVLTGNNFTGPFPSSIVKLPNIRVMDAAINDLTGSLPNDWTNLSSTLDTLQAAVNRLTGTLPDSLGSLTKLTTLNLFGNGFSGSLPASLGNLTRLRALQLGKDRITGTVPVSFAQLSSLQQLTLGFSELTGDLSFLCTGTEMLFPFMNRFVSDCLGENAEVICPCCNICCDRNNTCHDV